MKLLVLGGTGNTGKLFVNIALQQQASITAIVRNPDKLKETDANLTIIKGSPLDGNLLRQHLHGSDAVISLLGHTNLKKSSIVTDAIKELIKQMQHSGVRRLITISSTLVVPGGHPLTIIPRTITRHAIQDSRDMEEAVRASGLDWTVLRLVRLTNGPETTYHLFGEEPPSVTPSVSRKTVARCLFETISSTNLHQKTMGVRA